LFLGTRFLKKELSVMNPFPEPFVYALLLREGIKGLLDEDL
jgi:hypothetical protein